MAAEDLVESVGQYLFSDEKANVFAILDGASVDGLLQRLHRDRPEYACLYRGELAPDLAEVAPYLVALEPGTEFTDWVIGEGWGHHWGIFVVSYEDLRTLRRHFRTFLMVHTEEGKPLYFRYYDPRVLRAYLPTCDTEELATVFGPVEYYLLEDEDPGNVRRFRIEGALRQVRLPLV